MRCSSTLVGDRRAFGLLLAVVLAIVRRCSPCIPPAPPPPLSTAAPATPGTSTPTTASAAPAPRSARSARCGRQSSNYRRELVRQLAANVEAELVLTEEDLRRIPTPTLLISGVTDFAVSLEQMRSMRRSIPRSEMVILNHAGMDGLANHLVQFTRANVVEPVILDFLDRHSGTAAPDSGVSSDGATARGRSGANRGQARRTRTFSDSIALPLP